VKWCLTWYSDFVAEMVVVESIKSCRELPPDSSQHNKFWFSSVLITFIRTINLSQHAVSKLFHNHNNNYRYNPELSDRVQFGLARPTRNKT
jgi:hypothetical protein